MSNRANDIRKRIAKRKRERHSVSPARKKAVPSYLANDEERFGGSVYPSIERGPGNETGHPLFKKETFIFKILLSAVLFLSVGILYKNQSPKLDNVRHFVSSTMENEFQFAAVTGWYEEQFGSPLALLPVKPGNEGTDPSESGTFAVPAVGKVTQTFEVNGQGVIVETDSKVVEAMSEGTVMEVSTKSDLGKTVVIQHGDGSETWYGNLGTIDVKLYDYVKTGQEVGTVMDPEGDNKGSFYFAIKQGERFIDPIQVIKFE